MARDRESRGREMRDRARQDKPDRPDRDRPSRDREKPSRDRRGDQASRDRQWDKQFTKRFSRSEMEKATGQQLKKEVATAGRRRDRGREVSGIGRGIRNMQAAATTDQPYDMEEAMAQQTEQSFMNTLGMTTRQVRNMGMQKTAMEISRIQDPEAQKQALGAMDTLYSKGTTKERSTFEFAKELISGARNIGNVAGLVGGAVLGPAGATAGKALGTLAGGAYTLKGMQPITSILEEKTPAPAQTLAERAQDREKGNGMATEDFLPGEAGQAPTPTMDIKVPDEYKTARAWIKRKATDASYKGLGDVETVWGSSSDTPSLKGIFEASKYV